MTSDVKTMPGGDLISILPAYPVDRRGRGGRVVEGRPFDPLLDRARHAVRKVSS